MIGHLVPDSLTHSLSATLEIGHNKRLPLTNPMTDPMTDPMTNPMTDPMTDPVTDSNTELMTHDWPHDWPCYSPHDLGRDWNHNRTHKIVMLGQFCTLVMLYISIRKIYDSFIEANHQALKNVRKTNAIKDTITSKGSPARDCIVGSTFWRSQLRSNCNLGVHSKGISICSNPRSSRLVSCSCCPCRVSRGWLAKTSSIFDILILSSHQIWLWYYLDM